MVLAARPRFRRPRDFFLTLPIIDRSALAEETAVGAEEAPPPIGRTEEPVMEGTAALLSVFIILLAVNLLRILQRL